MIKTIQSGSPYVVVDGGNYSNYVNNYSGAQGIGNLRFNTSTQNMEVWDGNNWMLLNMGHATVRLHDSANEAINWALGKLAEERRLKALAEQHPIIQDLMSQRDDIDAKLATAEKLVKEY